MIKLTAFAIIKTYWLQVKEAEFIKAKCYQFYDRLVDYIRKATPVFPMLEAFP